MFLIWLIGAIIAFGYSVYKTGRSGLDIGEYGLTIFWMSVAWPIVIAAVIIFVPFMKLYKLGEERRIAEQNKKKADTQ